jgi:glycosyltransferase involved in cell wall biosynthesis
MNILFFTPGFSVGGVAVVTINLANKFTQEGHFVHIVSFYHPPPVLVNAIHKEIHVTIVDNRFFSLKNINRLRHILKNENIDYVINQRGNNFLYFLFLILPAQVNLPLKIISVYHNQPGAGSNPRFMIISSLLQNQMPVIKRIYLFCKRNMIKTIHSLNMKYVYKYSDKFIVLSTRHINELCAFIKIKNARKVAAIPNPRTEFSQDTAQYEKERKIIFVGRLSPEKHVERVLDVWEIAGPRCQEWTLHIVGDGPERKSLEWYCKEKKTARVQFEGFCDPGPFYKKSRILLLTSEYEGFPLVLPEAMGYGVIPVVYNSFLSLEDIVENNETGLIVEPSEETKRFDRNRMAALLIELMSDNNKMEMMSAKAIAASKQYSVEVIYQKWIEFFSTL